MKLDLETLLKLHLSGIGSRLSTNSTIEQGLKGNSEMRRFPWRRGSGEVGLDISRVLMKNKS